MGARSFKLPAVAVASNAAPPQAELPSNHDFGDHRPTPVHHSPTPTTKMAINSANPLLSNSRASDTSPIVQLHPLVLLTITDCISRHTLRQQPGPVIGAILGAQNGQEVTMEVAFQAKLKSGVDGEITLDDEWFGKRLEDCRLASIHIYCCPTAN